MSEPEHGILPVVGNRFQEAPSAFIFNDGINDIRNNNLDQSLNNSVKYLDQQRILMEQENAVMALKVSEYEKALSEKDSSIESLHTDMINYQNNNSILTNQYKSIMESTKSLNNTGMRLKTWFNDISERINRLGDTLDNVKRRQKDVLKNNRAFQEKVVQVSSSIDSLFIQVNTEKVRANEELKNLKNNHSIECNTYKTNLEECFKEIANLKSENDSMAGILNEANIKLHKEKQSIIDKNQYFEDTANRNALLMNDIKVVTDKYDKILAENRSLKDELAKINISLNENKMQLELKQKTIDDQAELYDNIKQSEELNDILKKDNITLREHNGHLEKIKTDLMDDISNNIVYQNEIQEENENKFNHMCKNYDETLKMYEEKILHLTEKIELQKKNEYTIQNEVIQLKHNVQMSNNTITNLQEELKLNLTSIPELQNKIKSLNNDLIINNKKLQDCTTEFAIERSKLENDKIDLENQNKEQHEKLTEITANYIKYKSKIMPLYSEVLRLRQKCFLFQQQSSEQTETIEAVRNNEYVDEDVSNKNGLYVSYNTNQNPLKCTSKRNSSINDDNISLKKLKTSTDKSSSQVLSPEKKNMEDESKIQVDSIPNVAVKKSFKIPDDFKLSRNKLKSTFMQNSNLPKPNSPVPITKPSPTK